MAYKRKSPQPVVEGGTGATTLTGVLIGNGTSAITGNAVTQHDVLVGGASNAITSVAPSATSGIPLISQGSSSDPAFGTAVVAGGGTGLTTATTAYGVVCAGTTATGPFQVLSSLGSSTQVLTSNGASALPSFQALPTTVTTIAGDSGSATGSTITFNANSNSGSSIKFSASSATVNLNVTDASHNTIIGNASGNGSLSGSTNTSLGYENLGALTSGSSNAALGWDCLPNLTTGSFNVAIGDGAFNAAGGLTTGSYNIGIGYAAGNSQTTGAINSNIYLNAWGSNGESNVLRIGLGTGTGNLNLNAAYICGITGISVTGTAVLVSSGNQLGVTVSSNRYKENIADLKESNVLALQPRTFSYKHDKNKEMRTGLIAEEVEKIMPELVVYNKEGQPDSVMYHELPVLLLLEIQKLQKRVTELEDKLSHLVNF